MLFPSLIIFPISRYVCRAAELAFIGNIRPLSCPSTWTYLPQELLWKVRISLDQRSGRLWKTTLHPFSLFCHHLSSLSLQAISLTGIPFRSHGASHGHSYGGSQSCQNSSKNQGTTGSRPIYRCHGRASFRPAELDRLVRHLRQTPRTSLGEALRTQARNRRPVLRVWQ